ncbi:MAG: response regulator [Rubrivivax sp.]|nr:response regulator [Rubrivivax sp.]
MTSPLTGTRILLLVEDNPGDAQMVRELLDESQRDTYTVMHAPRLDEALRTLEATEVDVVVLDLRLPDAEGVDTVRAVRALRGQLPIVVLTGSDDERLALACIDAGAQDYLPKSDVTARNLKRAIGYSITRRREMQLREMEETLAGYRAMSSRTQGTSVTAALAKSGAISVSNPEAYQRIVGDYYRLLEPYLLRESDHVRAPRAVAEQLITVVGDHGGGPRDLLDIHLAAIERAMSLFDDPHSRTIVFEARLLALEMMGLLVDYYRVGHRRRFE